jgi:hypothetical protein
LINTCVFKQYKIYYEITLFDQLTRIYARKALCPPNHKNYLSVTQNVAASTQAIALNSLVFLYREFLLQPLDIDLNFKRSNTKAHNCDDTPLNNAPAYGGVKPIFMDDESQHTRMYLLRFLD